MANLSYIQRSHLCDLLQQCDPRNEMFVRVLSTTTLLLGADPLKPTHSIDLSTETIRAFTSDAGQSGTVTEISGDKAEVQIFFAPKVRKLGRRSGDYWFELKGKRFTQNSLKELLAEGLRAIETIKPGTLEKLSAIRLRSRRIVSHDSNRLFKSQHLASRYAEKLTDGWWYGTNNSANETEGWLVRACGCAGLSWGDDFVTSLRIVGVINVDDL